jgi:hypothetical protein
MKLKKIYIQNDIKKRIAIKWTKMNFEEKKQMRGWIISDWRVELRRKTKFTK